MQLNTNALDVHDFAVTMIGDSDGDGINEIGVFGYGTGDGKLHSWIFEGNSAAAMNHIVGGLGDYSGLTAAGIGDIDGDGTDEYIIGAPHFDDGATDVGSVSIVGSAVAGPTFGEVGASADDKTGLSVTGLGDLNNDGYADFAYSLPGGETVRLFFGAGTDGLLMSSDFTFTGPTNFGVEVSMAGDHDQDGFGDILIGSPNENAAYIYSGHDPSFVQLAKITGAGIGTGDEAFGNAVLGGFDLDADGIGDFVIAGGDNAYIVYGKAGLVGDVSVNTLMNGTEGFMINGDMADIVNGAVAGDFNADGYDDLVLVSSHHDGTQYINDIFVIYGGTDLGSGGTVNLSMLDDSNVDSSNYAFQMIWDRSDINGENLEVSSAGDIDGDGFDDLLVASPDSNQAFIVYGRPTYGSLDGSDPDIHAVGINHTAGMDVRPSSDGDALVGNNGNDILIDEIAGSPGTYGINLSMRGGGGADILKVFTGRVDGTGLDDHISLDGGAGVGDTLEIVGNGTIDFSNVAHLSGIERIDMLNSVANNLVLGTGDVFSLAGDEHRMVGALQEMYVLTVDGETGDSVDLTNGDFTYNASANEAGYSAYVHSSGNYAVLIDTDVTVNLV
jgi:hypothetical protein